MGPLNKHNKKLSKILEKHEEMGEQLKSLKNDLDGPKEEECDQGWKNIENFFQGQQGENRAQKIVKFMSMLRDDWTYLLFKL